MLRARPAGPTLAHGVADFRKRPLSADRQQWVLSPRRRPRRISTSSRSRRKRRVSACLEAYRATSDIWWYEQAQRAFDWFIGWNDLGLELYSPETGGCRDGLHVDRVNGNQGAESTLAFLLSLAEMRLAQNILTSFKEPIARRRAVAATSAERLQCPSSSNEQPRFSVPTRRAFFCGPFTPGDAERVAGIIGRIMALPEDRVGPLLDEVSAEFSQRHQQIHDLFLERFEQVRESC